MRLIKGLQRRRSTAIALAAAFGLVGGTAVWHVSGPPAEVSSEDKQGLRKRLRRGGGSEVRFVVAADRLEQIDEAVASVDEFS